MTIQLNLTDEERRHLRQQKVKVAEISYYAADELAVLLQTSEQRARELLALADFQRIPSIGIEFAKDLIFLGFYAMAELREQDGAVLTDAYERKKGYQIDPCVEDQFRLAVHYARTGDASKRWWDFTAERKAFRQEHGYPQDRPDLNWHEVI